MNLRIVFPLLITLSASVSLDAATRGWKVAAVKVSSIESNRPEMRGENAVDGNEATRWASEFTDPQWIQLDLGEPRTVSEVTIEWEAAYARRYQVSISSDALKWQTVFTEEQGDGGKDVISFASQTTRYVRVMCIERATEWGCSIMEIRMSDAIRDDGRPPAAPSGLSTVSADGAVFLEWAASGEEDWRHFNVYRSRAGDTNSLRLNRRPVRESRWADETATRGVAHAYRVSAVDAGGREGAASVAVTGSVADVSRRDFYRIPACAWRRYLGDIPAACISTSPNRGIALGGFGAGSFMYTIGGSFGPFQTFDNTLYKPVWLDAAAFHVYEKVELSPSMARCLATDNRLKSAWRRLKAGEGVYRALQPKGWVTYTAFQTDISQKFFTPILPNNYKETSYPVGLWTFRVHNPATNTAEVSVMLTFPGVYVGENLAEDRFETRAVNGPHSYGVVLRSSTGLGEWCIAVSAVAGSEISRVTSWNAKGDGSDIWNEFRDDGVLVDSVPVDNAPGPHALDDSQSAAALAVKLVLGAGETREIPFAIAWDFPVVRFNSGTEWWKKYTEYFGRAGTNAFAIAAEALDRRAQWEAKLDAWMKPVLACDQYPNWLKCAAFNELYYNQFGGVFYEAGLKSGHDHEFMELHEDDHKHYVMESPVYTSANTLDVRHYASVEFARFWPEIERDTLKVYADGTLHYQFDKPVPVGLVPHDVGDPKKCDPFFLFDVYRHDLPDMLYWKDLSSKFVQQCWRYYKLTQDRETLDYVWPACKAVFAFMQSTDEDGDRLPDNAGSDNTYDAWGLYGTSLLCGGLWVVALESLEAMAVVVGDPELNKIRECLTAAKKNLDKELWVPKRNCYRMDTRGRFPTAIMSDGLNGQLYCRRYGLADILPADRMTRHLKRTFELCVKPLKDYTGDGVGDLGAVNAINEDGSLLGTLQSDEIWTGSSYFLAALMADAGLREEALKTAYGVYYNTYVNPETAFWFNTPEGWRLPDLAPRPSNPEQYQRPRAVWELLLSLHDPYR